MLNLKEIAKATGGVLVTAATGTKEQVQMLIDAGFVASGTAWIHEPDMVMIKIVNQPRGSDIRVYIVGKEVFHSNAELKLTPALLNKLKKQCATLNAAYAKFDEYLK